MTADEAVEWYIKQYEAGYGIDNEPDVDKIIDESRAYLANRDNSKNKATLVMRGHTMILTIPHPESDSPCPTK